MGGGWRRSQVRGKGQLGQFAVRIHMKDNIKCIYFYL